MNNLRCQEVIQKSIMFYSFEWAQDMVLNVVMDAKKRYSISGDQSVIDAVLNMASVHGDKSLNICAALAHWTEMPEEDRRKLRLSQALVQSRAPSAEPGKPSSRRGRRSA